MSFCRVTSCVNTSQESYSQREFKRLLSIPNVEILDTIQREKSEIFLIYENEGALGGHHFYLLHKKGSSNYHRIFYPDSDESIKKLESEVD